MPSRNKKQRPEDLPRPPGFEENDNQSHSRFPPIERTEPTYYEEIAETPSDTALRYASVAASTAYDTASRVAAATASIDWYSVAQKTYETATYAGVKTLAVAAAYGGDNLAAAAAATESILCSKNFIPFEHAYSENERIAMYEDIMRKFPSHVPVVLERVPGSQLEPLTKKKIVVQPTMTLGTMRLNMRKYVQECDSSKGIFIADKHRIPLGMQHETVGEVYCRKKSPDGFLYLYYMEEHVFGG